MEIEGAQAAAYLEGKVRATRTHAAHNNEDATMYGLAGSMLTPCIEFFRLGGTPEGMEHALKIVEIAVEELKDGLHIPDLPDPPG